MDDGIQPISTEIRMFDGVFAKSMVIRRKGDQVPQHSHPFAHASVVVKGSIRAWQDGQFLGEFFAMDSLRIPAHTKHVFEALEDGTIMVCVHDIGMAEGVEVHDEHVLTERMV